VDRRRNEEERRKKEEAEEERGESVEEESLPHSSATVSFLGGSRMPESRAERGERVNNTRERVNWQWY
jgi:hypothetical protein